jgi:pre-mRNA-splicing factor CWC26
VHKQLSIIPKLKGLMCPNKKEKAKNLEKRQKRKERKMSETNQAKRNDNKKSLMERDHHENEKINVAMENYDSDSRENQFNIRKMTTGHNAGLQSSAEFRKKEQEIQRSKACDVKALDRGETVYRNKDGQTISVNPKSDTSIENISKHSWNMGTVQKNEMLNHLKEEQIMTLGSFSRTVADVDKHRRDIFRDGDPMGKHGTSLGTKKIYKGPQPKPNRFGIRPGYRWDGVDRGSGFEDQVLAVMYARGRKMEERYKWSCADM